MQFELEQFFKCPEVMELADLVAVKIEADRKYYIVKCRPSSFTQIPNGTIISQKLFNSLNRLYSRQIILSDIYIKLPTNEIIRGGDDVKEI